MLKLKLQYFGHLLRRADSLEKTLMLGKIEGKRRKGWQVELVGWHHWLSGHEFEQTPGDTEGQGSLECCSPWGRKSWIWLSDWTTTNNKNTGHVLSYFKIFFPFYSYSNYFPPWLKSFSKFSLKFLFPRKAVQYRCLISIWTFFRLAPCAEFFTQGFLLGPRLLLFFLLKIFCYKINKIFKYLFENISNVCIWKFVRQTNDVTTFSAKESNLFKK